MYCIKCGVELADTEKKCPLCMTRVYHPDISQPEAQPLYPENKFPQSRPVSKGFPVFMTGVFVLAAVFSVVCDLRFGSGMTWALYVAGALLVAYVSMILPAWFKKPNPVVFIPCGFAAVAVYLLYIDLATQGGWFMRFAFPVVGVVCVLNTALVALLKYVRKGKLYIVGGFFILLGGFMMLLEFLLQLTFGSSGITGWSVYPLTALALIGGYLIFLGICRPAREAMERKFFF